MVYLQGGTSRDVTIYSFDFGQGHRRRRQRVTLQLIQGFLTDTAPFRDSPLVVLFDDDRGDGMKRRGGIGDDPDDVRAPHDHGVETFE